MNRVDMLAWDVVRARLAGGALAILPIGAGAKQHGWHLPMRTDQVQAEWLAARLAQSLDALVWPTLTYGHYPAFVAYAGSCSLSAGTFETMMRELVVGLLVDASRVLVLDTGISTNAPIARAVTGLRERVLHLKIYEGARYREAAARVATQSHGAHADELETSCMLAIDPAMVAMERAAASATEPPGPGPMQHADPEVANYSPSGVIGDSTGATSAKGEALLIAILDDLRETVDVWRRGTDVG